MNDETFLRLLHIQETITELYKELNHKQKVVMAPILNELTGLVLELSVEKRSPESVIFR